MDRDPNTFQPDASQPSPQHPLASGSGGASSVGGPGGHRRMDANALAGEFHALDRGLDQVLHARGHADHPSMPAGLADRIFIASRASLPSDVLANISSIGVQSGARGITQRGNQAGSTTRSRWARAALAAAAVLTIAAGSLIAFERSNTPRGGTQLASPGSSGSADGVADMKGMNGTQGTTSSAAELTLVAMHAPNQSRSWISEESLGGSEAAGLAAPILRTQGAAIDDIESELEAILGFADAGIGSSPTLRGPFGPGSY